MIDEGTKYILDANVFIEAHRRYYSFDIAPSFWNFHKYFIIEFLIDKRNFMIMVFLLN